MLFGTTNTVPWSIAAGSFALACWALLRHKKIQAQLLAKTTLYETLRQRFDSICASITEGVIITDPSGMVLYHNAHVANVPRLLVQENARLHDSNAAHPEFRVFNEVIQDKTSSGQSNQEQQTTIHVENRAFVVRTRLTLHQGQLVGRIWTLIEITSHQKVEDDLLQSQKMETVGQLAAGIAHEFNNLLMGVHGNLELAQAHRAVKNDDELSDYISSALRPLKRATELSRDLLNLSRKTILNLRRTNVNQLIGHTKKLLMNIFDSSVMITTELAPDLWAINADEPRLEQVLLNLCVNARDAFGGEPGRIHVSTRNAQHALFGESVVISVQDDGAGISEEVKRRIFEPFFTTKETGKGTGLGLTIARGIIDQHRGELTCTSAANEGTTFQIHIPRAKDSGEDSAPDNKDGASFDPNEELAGSATIMLVDDEQLVRDTTSRALRIFGYRVVEMRSGDDALKYFENATVDLIIMDLNMPGMSGQEFFLNLRKSSPEIPVVIASGFLNGVDELMQSETPPLECIAKPYSPIELLRRLQEILNGKV